MKKIFFLFFVLFLFTITRTAAQAPVFNWASPMSAASPSHSYGYATHDQAGNVYGTGTFQGTVDFDPGPGTMNITAIGQYDMYLWKLDAAGNLVWIKTFTGGSSTQCFGYGVAMDPYQNIVMIANTNAPIDVDPGPGVLTLEGQGIICKYSPTGNLIWGKEIAGTGSHGCQISAIDVNIEGNIYTTGYYHASSGYVDFDPGPGTYNLNTGGINFDGFVLKLDSIGNFNWVQTFNGTGIGTGRDVVSDNAGSVFVTGSFQNTHTFGSTSLHSTGDFDIFTARLGDITGSVLWAHRTGGSQRDDGLFVDCDAAGNPIVSGTIVGTVNGSFSMSAPSGTYYSFIAKYNSSGSLTWPRFLGPDVFVTTSVDETDHILIAGNFFNTIDIDPDISTSQNIDPVNGETFIAKWGQAPDLVWEGQIKSTSSYVGLFSITGNSSGDIFLAGEGAGTTDFDPSAGNTNTILNNDNSYILKWGACVPNSITSPPSNAIVCENDNAFFSVSATGTGLTYQWQVDQGSGFNNLTNTPPYSNVTNPILNITNVSAGMNNYAYRCIVNGTCGSPINSAGATLTVNPNASSSASAQICNGDSYIFGTQTLTSTGTYNEVFTSINGCDSTVILTLTVNPTYSALISASICNGDSYILGTQTLNSAGIYSETFNTIHGCDSVVTLTLSVNTVYNTTTTASICNGESYIFGTQTLTSAGTYSETFNTIQGCDSIVDLTLSVNPIYNITTTASICNGDFYGFGSQTLTLAGTFNETFSSMHGCDSTVTLILTVNPVYSISTSASICNGDSYILGSQTLTSAGTYSETFNTVHGCDSIVTLVLSVNSALNTTATNSICNGDSYTFGTQTLTTPGIYNETFASVHGCDSIVTLTLTVHPTFNISTDTTICNGTSYVFGSQVLTSAGTYSEIFNTIHGCDSTVNLTLSIHSVLNIHVEDSICSGDTYIFGAQILNSPGNYTETFVSITGCDSIVNLDLHVNSVNTSISQSGVMLTANATGAGYQWIDCNNSNTPIPGANVQSFTALNNGNYAVIITTGSCSDTSNCFLINNVGLSEITGEDISVYPNPAENYLVIDMKNPEGNISYQIYDQLGKIASNGYIQSYPQLIPIAELSSGIYVMNIQMNDQVIKWFKIVKK